MKMDRAKLQKALDYLEIVEQLLSNEEGKNEFRRWLTACAKETPEANWLKDNLPPCTSYIFDLCGFIEAELEDGEHVNG